MRLKILTNEQSNQRVKCGCRCHKGILGICLWCQDKSCSYCKPKFNNKTNAVDTRVKDTLMTLRRDS